MFYKTNKSWQINLPGYSNSLWLTGKLDATYPFGHVMGIANVSRILDLLLDRLQPGDAGIND